jgi:hypothetical protein
MTKVIAHGRDTQGKWRQRALAEAVEQQDTRKRWQTSEEEVPPGVPDSIIPMRIGYE